VPLESVMDRLEQSGIAVLEGPVMKTGAVSKLRSVYVRDPDLNLIEISVPV
jgi:catechol 2,3-dioxygenase-like lactoylglutathione lyase family enzyme